MNLKTKNLLLTALALPMSLVANAAASRLQGYTTWWRHS